MRLLIAFLFLIQGWLHAQDVTGTWNSTYSLVRDTYILHSSGVAKYIHSGDLAGIVRQGAYSVRSDSVFIVFDTTLDGTHPVMRENRKPLACCDTLIRDHPERLSKSFGAYRLNLYRVDRALKDLNVDDAGRLSFSIEHFGDTVSLLHQQPGVGLKTVAQWSREGSERMIIEDFQLAFHNGKNEFWLVVKQFPMDEVLTVFRYNVDRAPIKIKKKRVKDVICLSGRTYYTLLNEAGEVLLEGSGCAIDCSSLEKGRYLLRFDQQEAYIVKK